MNCLIRDNAQKKSKIPILRAASIDLSSKYFDIRLNHTDQIIPQKKKTKKKEKPDKVA